ncbi:16S rRNA (adenine(1518)-N(6)/adenine(1519)-N(6))-dimethyltransferase RsmA [Mycoplasma buteonis]|uniref:16S rRNA (adenine(1518)-N(6)/adenine(1519)-N(6))- dimethyltransferase RsmA n=1 Tax=Mycoplasma buteonis TaxID=171280 RepID=UPI00055A4864|nr:16S rRNA (adenine(1518)-N(6)/adenine(1519)-N(6))-dimethyltransferase RsmA [Mycoplasma buteonis]
MQNKKEVFAKKQFGQNFLNDKNIINKILQVFPYQNNNVLEIGPGRGALTKELIKDAKEVICYEIDADMVEILNKEIQADNFKLIHQDFLKANLSDIPENTFVIANIPYYITSDILFKLFQNRQKFAGLLLMVQKEVAQRIVAKKNSKDYSKLSVSSQYLANCKIEFIVPAKCFVPAPKVDSAIISLTFKNSEQTSDWEALQDFFKLCFLARRKKLSYSLKTKYSVKQISFAYQKLNKNDNLRIQELDLEEIVILYELLNQ